MSSFGRTYSLIKDIDRVVFTTLNNNRAVLANLGKVTSKFSIYGDWFVFVQGVEGDFNAEYRYIKIIQSAPDTSFVDNISNDKICLCFGFKPQHTSIVRENTDSDGNINHEAVLKLLVQDEMIIAKLNAFDGNYYQNSFESPKQTFYDLSSLPGGFNFTISAASRTLSFSNNDNKLTEYAYMTNLFNNTANKVIYTNSDDYNFVTQATGLTLSLYEDVKVFEGDVKKVITLTSLS